MVPDSSPVHPPVVPPLPDEFRLVYFNVNGLEGFKFAELLIFMAIEAVNCMVLIACPLPVSRSPGATGLESGVFGLHLCTARAGLSAAFHQSGEQLCRSYSSNTVRL